MYYFFRKVPLWALVILLYFFSACNSGKNGSGGYRVDASIKGDVAKKALTYEGFSMGTVEVKLYENDSLIANTAGALKNPECITMPELKGDTIEISGFMGMFSGFGYQIALFKDTCLITHIVKTDVAIYKLHKSDLASFGIAVPCKQYKLTLSEKPTFKKGQVIDGIVSLTSEDYYEVDNSGKDIKVHVELTGYFTTGPLMSAEERDNNLHKR